MIPELGHFALVIALAIGFGLAYFSLLGASREDSSLMSLSRPAAVAQFVFVAFAFGCLTWTFVQNDFSVTYVAMNSNSELPLGYRIAAVWGAHEGSLLLWALVLTAWTLAVALFSSDLPQRFASRVLGILGLVNVGFLLFTLLTSNPFLRQIPPALDGRDLNPLLQDPGLAIHPPMLYIGYVGFSVAFAFAIAALIDGRLDRGWARWTRRWTTLAWLFLTVGIALGSWWAYYELGWGGWWFWDPVENASFMPWLVGTALIHSLAVTEKRGASVAWTILLAIAAFSLSLLGTFLVRSGVLVSVHAFATDPWRGAFILAFLATVILGALILYAWRGPKLVASVRSEVFSRETFLLLNNILLVTATALILLGTLYPLFLDALQLGKISVGPPYFAVVFLIPMLPLVFLLGTGPQTYWQRDDMNRVLKRLRWPFVAAVVLGIVFPLGIYGGGSGLTVVGTIAAFWVMLTAGLEVLAQWRRQKSLRGIPRRVWGMTLAHFGVGVFILGVTVTNTFGLEKDLSISPGGQVSVGEYTFLFTGVREIQGPNYRGVEGIVMVAKDDKAVATLRPQKRVYLVQQNPMTEAAIDPALSRDLFVAMGESLGGGAWSMRFQYKPLIRCIWLGAILMALGGGIAASDRRYRLASSYSASTIGQPTEAAT